MIDELNPKFLEFLEMYERIYKLPIEKFRSPYLNTIKLDKEAEGLLDDLKFLLTNETCHQEITRKDLRRFMGKIAHDLIKLEIK